MIICAFCLPVSAPRIALLAAKKIEQQSAQQIVDIILALPEGTKINVLAPLIRGRKGEYRNIGKQIAQSGFARMRINGKIYETGDPVKLDKYKIHHIEVVVDRLTIRPDIRKRLSDSVETALKTGEGMVMVDFNGQKADQIFSEKYACADCGTSLSEMSPRIFSFNSPYGACPGCNGLGTKMEIDPVSLVPDASKPWVSCHRSLEKRPARVHDVLSRCIAGNGPYLQGGSPFAV